MNSLDKQKASSEHVQVSAVPLQQDQQSILLQLWDEHAEGMLRHVLASTGSREISEEAVQEAFTAILGRMRLGDEILCPKESLYQALYQAIELKRTQAEPPGANPDAPDYERPDLDAPLRAAEVRKQWLRLVSFREFEMLRLRADGFSYTEIARVLAVSPGTVASTLAKAFRKIRAGLVRR